MCFNLRYFRHVIVNKVEVGKIYTLISLKLLINMIAIEKLILLRKKKHVANAAIRRIIVF